VTGEDDPKLEEIKDERSYSYSDVVNFCPDKLPGYEEKVKNFFKKHIHFDEEIRFCMEGTGYFDVRNAEDRWIRAHLEAGDVIILPEGSFHRFTTDKSNFIKAMRLFAGEPIWTPYNRDGLEGSDDNTSRVKYVQAFLASNKKQRMGSVGAEADSKAATE